MEKVVENIIEAENRARDIIKEAEEKASTVVKNARETAENNYRHQIDLAVKDGITLVDSYRLKAEEEAEDILKAAEKEGEQIRVNALYKLDGAVDLVKRAILGE